MEGGTEGENWGAGHCGVGPLKSLPVARLALHLNLPSPSLDIHLLPIAVHNLYSSLTPVPIPSLFLAEPD